MVSTPEKKCFKAVILQLNGLTLIRTCYELGIEQVWSKYKEGGSHVRHDPKMLQIIIRILLNLILFYLFV